MGTLVILNDVITDIEEAGLLIGGLDCVCNKNGNAQSNIIADYVNEKVQNIDVICNSDAIRIRKLIHKIRVSSKNQTLTNPAVQRTLEALKERNFGVLNNTPVHFESDLFSNTRIKAEKGESIFECRVRLMKCIIELVKKYAEKTVLIVSHPFSCQILFNALLQKDHSILTQFWQNKGSFVVLNFSIKKHGISWEFRNAYNAILNTTYSQNEIYNGLLGTSRTFPG